MATKKGDYAAVQRLLQVTTDIDVDISIDMDIDRYIDVPHSTSRHHNLSPKTGGPCEQPYSTCP